MPRKKSERLIQFNRDNILETAEKLFSDKGIQETTMDDISKAADYSKSTIYVYFKSKDEIFYYIVYKHMCHLQNIIKASIQEDMNFERCYFHICMMLANDYEQHPLYFESVMGNISIDEKDMAENEILYQIYKVGETINDNLATLFEKGIKEDYLKQNILILPTIFTFWASLTNIVLIANNKEKYIEKRMNMEKLEFMQYSFKLLLSSIKKG